MAESIFYVVELALRSEHLPRFATWYAAVHAPHLFQAGFTTCTSYVAVEGGLSVVDIYQAPDWSMFETPAFARYREVAAADAYRPGILAEVSNPRTVYVHGARSPLPSPDPDAPLDADWVLTWRFAGDESFEEQAAEWLGSTGWLALKALGATGARLLHRGRDAPTGRSFRPRLALVSEWRTRPSSAKALTVLPDSLRGAVEAAEGFLGLRLYPWPGDPSLHNEMTRRVAGGT
jgi:hypothetical protein